MFVLLYLKKKKKCHPCHPWLPCGIIWTVDHWGTLLQLHHGCWKYTIFFLLSLNISQLDAQGFKPCHYIYIWRKKMAELCSWCLWETKSLKVSFSQCLSKHILWLHQDISVMIPFWDKQWAGMQVLYSLFTITYFMLVENQDYIQIGI